MFNQRYSGEKKRILKIVGEKIGINPGFPEYHDIFNKAILMHRGLGTINLDDKSVQEINFLIDFSDKIDYLERSIVNNEHGNRNGVR